MNCLFCQIIEHKIKSQIVHEDEISMGFEDIRPQAPEHILIIPKRHIATLNDLQAEDQHLIGHLILIAKKIAREKTISEKGYRLIFNCNPDGGQEVYHIHLHLLGGRQLAWPPG